MLDSMMIRRAEARDAAGIARIYNHYILNTTVTFDTEPKSAEDRRSWLEMRDTSHVVLVAEEDRDVVAWGALSPWGVRPAYRSSVEVSVYVAPESRGRGIGSRLMSELLREAEAAGHHALLSQIVSDNTASIDLALRYGFQQVGHLREVGLKFGEWLDVVILERIV